MSALALVGFLVLRANAYYVNDAGPAQLPRPLQQPYIGDFVGSPRAPRSRERLIEDFEAQKGYRESGLHRRTPVPPPYPIRRRDRPTGMEPDDLAPILNHVFRYSLNSELSKVLAEQALRLREQAETEARLFQDSMSDYRFIRQTPSMHSAVGNHEADEYSDGAGTEAERRFLRGDSNNEGIRPERGRDVDEDPAMLLSVRPFERPTLPTDPTTAYQRTRPGIDVREPYGASGHWRPHRHQPAGNSGYRQPPLKLDESDHSAVSGSSQSPITVHDLKIFIHDVSQFHRIFRKQPRSTNSRKPSFPTVDAAKESVLYRTAPQSGVTPLTTTSKPVHLEEET